MTNFIRSEISKISKDANRKLNYAIELNLIVTLKKKKMIDETIYNSLEEYLKKKYNIK